MPRSTRYRLLLAAGVLIAMLALLAVLLGAVQWTLSLWQQLRSAPVWLQLPSVLIAALLLGFGSGSSGRSCARSGPAAARRQARH